MLVAVKASSRTRKADVRNLRVNIRLLSPRVDMIDEWISVGG